MSAKPDIAARKAADNADYIAQLTGSYTSVRADFCGGWDVLAAGVPVARVDAFGDVHILVGIHALTEIAKGQAA